MKQIVPGLEQTYKRILQTFLDRQNELGLYEAQQFSKVLLEHQLSPEELVSIHHEVLEELFPTVPVEVLDSFDLLLEVMMGYGLAYREHQSLKDRQFKLEAEIDVAADMQQTLLPQKLPTVDSLDIGVVSAPANKMSGDYYNIILDDQGCLAIAIADIIGKGVPAALCMSMIKYAMESLPEQRLQPSALLENLNRVVEQNVADSMFVTMMYGSYDSRTHLFSYSAAGHEPGLLYCAKTNEFHDLYAKGLALGIVKKAEYCEKEVEVNPGDFIVFFTDGVTESRNEKGIIEKNEILRLISKYKHLPAQKLADKVYYDLLQMQNFVLQDDFTLMIVRRNV